MLLDVIVRLLRGGEIVNKSGRSLDGEESAAVLGDAVIGEMALGEGG